MSQRRCTVVPSSGFSKIVDVLTNVLLRDKVVSRLSYQNPYPLEGEIGNAAILFLNHMEDLRRKEKSIRPYRKMLSNFVEYLNRNGIINLCGITEETILDYVSSREHRQAEYIRAVKRFLTFVYDQRLATKDWSYIIKNLGNKFKHIRIPSF